MSSSLKKSTTTTSSRLVGFDAPTVWQEFTPLAIEKKAVNLGQGFPDWNSPDFAKDALINAVTENHNQYCRSAGETNLVQALSKHYSTEMKREINPLTEIATTVGATEALFGVMQSYVEADDEVIVIEPMFDIYAAQIQMAGGKMVTVPLEPPTAENFADGKKEWTLDLEQLEASITSRTKLLLLNTPHNPTGFVYNKKIFTQIAEIMQRHPHVTCVTDEVYEKIVFTDEGHCRLATIPGMWDRTITVSSAGKTFSVTGWKVGWVIGPEHLIKPVYLTNQWVQYSVCTPAQKAVADMITFAEKPYEGFPSYYTYLCAEYRKKMEWVRDYATEAGLVPLEPEGGFFVLCDTSKIDLPVDYSKEIGIDGLPLTRDWAFCRWLTSEIGVAAIPPSAFFTAKNKPLAANLIRLCYCKEDASIHEAGKRLQKLKQYWKK
jgi:kynurenine--oxoglutarate transaminase/cysteine-S-conjugate beta-lyase/glutamine--phenylpyruvate transaminase